MTYTTAQLTSYAHEYLSGGNMTPIGALDSPEFKAICSKLSGTDTPEAKARQHKHLVNTVARLEAALRPLYGPRGGLPKQHRALEFQYHMLKGQLELEGQQ